MTIDETIEQIGSLIRDGDTPVIWFTPDRRSLLLVRLMQMVREDTPAIIFSAFWPSARTQRVTKLLNGIGIRAYTLSPVRAFSDGRSVTGEYAADAFTARVRERFEPSMFETLVGFEAEARAEPFYLWNKTFFAGTANEIFTKGEAYFPLGAWTEESLEQAYEKLSIPVFDENWRQLIEEAAKNGNASNAAGIGA